MKKYFPIIFFTLLFTIFSFGLDVEKFIPSNPDVIFISRGMYNFNRSLIDVFRSRQKTKNEWTELLNEKGIEEIDFAFGMDFPEDILKGKSLKPDFIFATSFHKKKIYRKVKEIIFRNLIGGGNPASVKLSNFYIYRLKDEKYKDLGFGFSDRDSLIIFGVVDGIRNSVSSFLAEGGFNFHMKKELYSNLSDNNLKNKAVIFINFEVFENYLKEFIPKIDMLKGKKKEESGAKNPYSVILKKAITSENVKKFVNGLGIYNLKYFFEEFSDAGKFYREKEVIRVLSDEDSLVGKVYGFYVKDNSYKNFISKIPSNYNTVIFSRFPVKLLIDGFKDNISNSFGEQVKNLVNGFYGMINTQVSIFIGITLDDALKLIGTHFLYLANTSKEKKISYGINLIFPDDVTLFDKMVEALKGMKYKELTIKSTDMGKDKLYDFTFKGNDFFVLRGSDFLALSLSKEALTYFENTLNEKNNGVKKFMIPLLGDKDIVGFSYGDIFGLTQKYLYNSIVLKKFLKKSDSVLPANLKDFSAGEIFSNYRISYIFDNSFKSEGKFHKKYLNLFVKRFLLNIMDRYEKIKKEKKKNKDKKIDAKSK